ncbi:FGGY-family carbohydrate kinase [Biostraticola tofi]|uniref:Ribulokinase n=1 Tax=Biostraticola tofi TaxID=466109 RepID=A0A4R3YSU6_9GAMM|nr:FGGY-family carbohydrate kinase [Biostraticola tofi]TCV95486.1 ribulokinase [Biostraticola tofi]
MKEHYFMGVDVGSASVRAGVFTQAGERLAFAVRPINQFRPAPKRVEQSSREIWQQTCEAIREAVRQAGISPQAVASIGFDATCSLVAIDENGNGIPVSELGDDACHDIIMWMDHRAGDETAELNATTDEALNFVGGEISIEMQLPKALWLKRHLPERYQKAWRLFDLADFMVWRATGIDAASVCTLACKWNYLSHKKAFSDSLLEAVGLGELRQKIPPTILELGQPAGRLSTEAARECGLTTDAIVAGGIIDAHAGGLALVSTRPEGSLAVISGTSNCHMLVSADPVMVPGVWGPYWGAMLPGYWLNEGGQSAAGSLVEWTLAQHAYRAELQQLARRQNCSEYQLLNQWVSDLEQRDPLPTRALHVLADHHGNRSPRSDPDARGAIIGLTLGQGRDELARLYLATLQSIAYGTRHIIETMNQSGHHISRLVMCGGATKNPLWLREYANVTGCDIELSAEEDAVTLGAALLGAAAAGVFPSLTQAAHALVRPGDVIRTDPRYADFHQAKYQVYLKLYQDAQYAWQQMRRWR